MLQCTHMIQVACANLVMLWWLICYPKSWRKTSLTKSIRLMKIHSKKFCIFTVVIILLDRIHIWGYNRSYNREKSCCGQISVSYFFFVTYFSYFKQLAYFYIQWWNWGQEWTLWEKSIWIWLHQVFPLLLQHVESSH
jgi:hypothetical protein